MKLRFSILVLSSILSTAGISYVALGMEHISIIDNACDFNNVQNAAIVRWIRECIQPLHAELFKIKGKGTKANYMLIVEKCLHVLSNLEQPVLLPACNKNQEFKQPEHIDFISYHEFTEIIDVLDSKMRGIIQAAHQNSVKYIMSTRSSIIEDIQNIPGSAKSLGINKTLSGLIYYYHKDVDAGYLANFFRDSIGNIFFVDVQSGEITQTVPERVLDYRLEEEIFFYPVAPQSGYFFMSSLVQEQEKQNHAFFASNDLAHDLAEENLTYLDDVNQGNTIYTKTNYIWDYQNCYKAFSNSSKKSFVCDYPGCNKAFDKAGKLNQHTKRHEKRPYVCDYVGCDKTYSTSSDLTKHIRTHTGERPYVCDYTGCNEAYVQASHLKRHKRIHDDLDLSSSALNASKKQRVSKS